MVRKLAGLALAAIYDGGARSEAAKIGGVGLQVVRDWELRLNACGPDGLIDRKAPGQPSLLKVEHRAALARMIEDGPMPCIHGVVRWRIVDLCRRVFEEFRISVRAKAGALLHCGTEFNAPPAYALHSKSCPCDGKGLASGAAGTPRQSAGPNIRVCAYGRECDRRRRH